jgi:adenine-specific DNA-methyltransferase
MIDAFELKTIFEKAYNRTDWTNALRDIFYIKDLHIAPVDVELPQNNFDAKALELGFFESSEGLLIGLFEVSIASSIRLERNKVGLRNMMRNVYQRDMDAALIVFTQGSSWRFSYASELTMVNKDTGKREKRQTDPKRYTYLLGTGQHCRTAAERFARLKTSTDLFDTKVSIKEIEKAFSVDILTKDFYRELSNWYFWALNHVTFPNDDEPNEDTRNPSSLIRLITRLIFVWFLKQKGLVPDELFDKEKIWPHLKTGYDAESNYYKAILQNLFFATLNQEMNKRTFRRNGQHYNITNLYRYRKLFKNPEETVELFKNIPFLNGGLFECLDKPHPTEKTPQGNEKIVRIDGFSDRDDNPLCVPDYLFFGGAVAVDLSKVYDDKRQRNVDVKGIIEILNSYNFTVEENTPLEIQVALDPELLGKVFENLLASYNPETKTTARKQTGSFYTPREIVNYMVDESLIAYLKQKLIPENNSNEEEAETKLRELVSYSGNGNPFDETQTQTLVSAIDEIKVLDPACGSGAFPMGILQQLVHVLQKLDPENERWKQLQLQRAQTEIQQAIEAGDTASFSERLKEIADAFDNNAEDYGRKLYLIENCIYGVDIQPIAVQIAKLRFFISLLVDQNIDPEAENLGIRALPNLETKFVAANTLIPINKQGLVLRNLDIIEKEKALKQVRHKYFIARTPEQKRKMRAADEKLREEIAQVIYREAMETYESNKAILERKQLDYKNSLKAIEGLKHEAEKSKFKKNLKKLAVEINNLKAALVNPDVVDQTAKMLAGWNPYEQNKYAGFFDSEWMFGIMEGFDMVIGNPPYLAFQRMETESKKAIQSFNYKTFEYTGDIYVIFYERGQQLLCNKGILSYITSRQWMQASYGKSLRKFFANETNPIQLIDFGQTKIFEGATVFVNILIFEKAKNNNFLQACLIPIDYNIERGNLTEFLTLNKQELKNLSENTWAVSYDQLLYDKISIVGKPLRKWNDLEFFRGITSGLNEAFHINKKTKDYLIKQNENNEAYIKPLLRGKDIKRYNYDFEEIFMLFIPWHFPLHNDRSIINSSEKAEKAFIEQYRDIYNHLLTYKTELSNRNKSETGIRYEWYALQRYGANFWENFTKPKIVWIEISDRANYALDEKGMFLTNSAYFLTSKDNKVSLKYLLAVLNSKVADFYFSLKTARIAGGRMRYTKQYVEQIPIPEVQKDKQQNFISLVDQILNNKKSNAHANKTTLENRIDELVFKLYDLTYEEVKVIAPDFWLSEEEYENIKLED